MSGPYASPMTAAPRTPILRLLLLTALAVLVHGYHLGADDAAIYVPAIKKVADPGLYPFGSEFFVSYSHLSFFADLVGDSARLTRLPIDFAILAWHAASIFLLLLAAWRLAGACFRDEAARWGGVALLAALLSVPVAGTALVIMDPYFTARSLSTPATLFAIACCFLAASRWRAAWPAARIRPSRPAWRAFRSWSHSNPRADRPVRLCSRAPTYSCSGGSGTSGLESSLPSACYGGSPL
jgi:hypothetical protein